MKEKVVCIDKGSYHLTVGKIYDASVVLNDKFGYFISNDFGYRHYVESNLFRLLSDIRVDKLNKLGIN